MRYSSQLVVLAATASAASAISYKGISPDQLSLYEAKVPSSSPAKWKCLNTSQEIPHTAVNDNYCDCEDGSDEPGTGACATGQFWCANEGHVGAFIRASRVNDGLCEPECCDGSDEAEGMCPNVCHVAGEEHRQQVEAERKLRKTGSKIRSTYINFAQKEKTRLEASIQTLTAELEQRKSEEAKLKETWEHAASLDEERLNLRKQSPTYNTVQDHVSLLDHLTSEQRALKDRIASLESVLTNLKAGYNPNYQDMAVLEAVRGWDALKPAEKEEIEDADQVEGESNDSDSVPEEPKWTESRINELKRTDPLSILLEHERHINGGVDDEVTKLLFSLDQYIPDGLLPIYESLRDTVTGTLAKFGLHGPTSAPPGGSDSDAKKQAYEAAQSKVRDISNKLGDDTSALKTLTESPHFGNKGEWKKLENTCIEKNTGEYTYSLCFFGQASQKSNNGGSTNLGRFSVWNTDAGYQPGDYGYYTKQTYPGGAQCWNGPVRSVKVDLSCGTENALLSIAEPEKCEYLYVATTPALCWTDEELEALSKVSEVPAREDL